MRGRITIIKCVFVRQKCLETKHELRFWFLVLGLAEGRRGNKDRRNVFFIYFL